MNKYISFFSKMDIVDWKKFTQFVYLNYKKQVLIIQLIKSLEKKHPAFKIDIDTINAHIYKDTEVSNAKYLWNRLYKIALQFIALESTKKSANQHIEQLNYLKNIQAKKQYEAIIYRVQTNQDPYDYTLQLFLHQENMEKISALADRSKEPQIQVVHDKLDENYIYEKLKTSCASLSFSQLQPYEYDYGLLDWIAPQLKTWLTKKDPLIQTWYYTYLLLKHQKQEDYDQVFKSLKTEKNFPKADLPVLYTVLINFCIKNINRGNENYFQQLFNLYQLQIQSKIIYNQDGFISPFTLKNILTVSLRLNEIKWSEKFIQQHKEKLPLASRDENYEYNLARIYFAKRDYVHCLRYVLRSEPIDFLNNISSRVLQIKAFYVIDDYNSLDNALHNFRLYLHRHKNKGYHYTYHVHFIQFLKKVMAATKTDKPKLRKKLAQLKHENKIAEHKWLEEILG